MGLNEGEVGEEARLGCNRDALGRSWEVGLYEVTWGCRRERWGEELGDVGL